MEEDVVWAFGSGGARQLGLNTRDHQSVPARVGGLEMFGSGARAIAAGQSHSAVITADGALWTWGLHLESVYAQAASAGLTRKGDRGVWV